MPAATLQWLNPRDGVTLSGTDGEGVIPFEPGGPMTIGREASLDVVARGVLIGGRRNSRLTGDADGTWRYLHMGHSLPIFVNGASMRGEVSLAHGDVIEISASDGEGLLFVFERAAVGIPLARVRRAAAAIRDSFPGRAGAILGELRRHAWLGSPIVRGGNVACVFCGSRRENAVRIGWERRAACVPCLELAARDAVASPDAMMADVHRALSAHGASADAITALEALLLGTGNARCNRCTGTGAWNTGEVSFCASCLREVRAESPGVRSPPETWDVFQQAAEASSRPRGVIAAWEALYVRNAPTERALTVYAEALGGFVMLDPRPDADAVLAARELDAAFPRVRELSKLGSVLERI